MSNTASSVLAQARKDIGYWRHDDPKNGTKFGRWYAELVGSSYYGENGVPFCAMAVSYWFAQAGAKCDGLPEAYCPYILNEAKKAGAVLADKTKAKPGDVVLFDWDGGVVDHVGIVEKNLGSYIQTIEGNTTINGKSGSVGRRTRSWGTVKAVVRPSYDTSGTSGSSGTTKPSGGAQNASQRVEVDGHIGPKSVKELQRQLGTSKDGVISGQSKSDRAAHERVNAIEYGSGGSDVVLALQKFLRGGGYDIKADRYLGKKTVTALQTWMRKSLGYKKHAIDGILGQYTAYNLQNALNARAFE